MSAKTAVQPQSPDSLIAFLKLLLIGLLKKLPLKLILAGTIALLAWILHTYLLVVTNEGFNSGNSIWLDRILALQGRTITGTLVWTFGVGLVTSTIARVLAFGLGGTLRSIADTPKSLLTWAREAGLLVIPLLFAGYFLTIIFGFFVSNQLLIVQLLLIVIGILIARHTSIFMTILRLGYSDLQKLLKRENPTPFKLAWPGMYLLGVTVGLLAILPTGLFAFVCGCLGFLLLLLVSIGLFVSSPTGTKGVFGRKILSWLIFWIIPPVLFMLILAVSPVFADDGGWLESGGTLSGWISSPGAGRAVAMGFLPAAGSGLGVLVGTALGSMVSIVGATGMTGTPLTVRPTSTTSPPAEGTAPMPSRTAGHQTTPAQQQAEKFDLVQKEPQPPPGSRTADHQVEHFEYQDKSDPGQLSSRHETTAEPDASLRSSRAGQDAAPSRTGEGMAETGTGQRDVRGVQPTTGSETGGPGTGSAAESADRAAGFDQETPTGQMTASRHRPDTPESGGPLSDRHRPGGIDEAAETPTDPEQPGLRADRHSPEAPEGPTASRHEPGGLDEVDGPPSTLQQSGMKAERHTPQVEGGPSASRHEPDVAGDQGSGMRASRAPVDDAGAATERFSGGEPTPIPGPATGRHPVTEEPRIPIPPVPVPGYALDWELVVVRTPEGSGVSVQEQFTIEERMRIGRHGAVDLKILDPKVSRQHADIKVEGATCRIIDLQSSNGTFVNGRRLTEPAELKHGDAIKIGDTYFIVQQKAA